MTRRRRAKPRTPEQIALDAALRRAAERARLRDPAEWGVSPETAAQPDVVTVPETRTRLAGARRDDVFDRLHARAPERFTRAHLDAVRRLERDMAQRRGEVWRPPYLGRIDGGQGSRELVTRLSLKAAERVEAALGAVGYGRRRILEELIQPTVIRTDAVGSWRVIVALVAKVTDRDKQAALVRDAAEALRAHYAAVDRGEKDA